jgi:hypothetical protein
MKMMKQHRLIEPWMPDIVKNNIATMRLQIFVVFQELHLPAPWKVHGKGMDIINNADFID